eukprot:TRINITY_DN23725_c1_g1_i1.p1 TRINITY_DN23725_c1_g1~~TRINITY_DN23725_c1_g1_i1.p1  ORF type:complete len:340 (+),score=65.98 TRINITY_DN23725_c1_g1_i1:70-1089(+)
MSWFSGKKETPAAVIEKLDPKDLVEGLQKPTFILWIFFAWFACSGIVGLFFPEMMLKARGVYFHEECSSGPRSIILTMEQTQVMQSLFMAGLHYVVLHQGAAEARLVSTHHMGAVRTLLLTDTVWLAISCTWAWVFAIPAMREQSWHHDWVLWESFLLAILGLAAFVESRGDVVSVMGGLVQAQTNAAYIKWPKLITRNYALYAWLLIAGVAGPIHVLLPDAMLWMYTGDYMKATCRSMSSLLVQLTGCCLLNQALSITAILGSSVLALHYTATRLLWVWSFGMTIYILGTHQVYLFLGLNSSWHYLCVCGFLVVCITAKFSMAAFSTVDMTTRMVGRT